MPQNNHLCRRNGLLVQWPVDFTRQFQSLHASEHAFGSGSRHVVSLHVVRLEVVFELRAVIATSAVEHHTRGKVFSLYMTCYRTHVRSLERAKHI